MYFFLLNVSNTELPYHFHWERDFSLWFLQNFQTAYAIFSLLTWHPRVLYLLFRHPGPLSADIRAGYIANQFCLMLNEWVLCWAIRIYPLMPYPAIYCDGPLCRLGLPQQVVTTILAFSVILPNPPFEFILLRMHQKLLVNFDSRFRFSPKAQNRMMYTLIAMLLINVMGFAVFGSPSAKNEEILNRREMSWLNERGGQLLIFGDVGNAESFVYECYLLALTLLIAYPVVAFFSIHATYIVHRAKKHTTNRTAVRQSRIISMLLIQMTGALFCYCVPLWVMVIAIIRPFSPIALAFIRPLITQSIVFLFKNVYYREFVKRVLHWFGRIFFSRPQTQSSLLQIEAFTNLPSSPHVLRVIRSQL